MFSQTNRHPYHHSHHPNPAPEPCFFLPKLEPVLQPSLPTDLLAQVPLVLQLVPVGLRRNIRTLEVSVRLDGQLKIGQRRNYKGG
jgi:hypothetical protein